MPASSAQNHPYDLRWSVYVEDKTYGPYTGHEVRQMTLKNEILRSDLVCREGTSTWVEAREDPILKRLFPPEEVPVRGHRGMTVRAIRRVNAVVVLLLLAVGWTIWPYYSLYQLSLALRGGDEIGLEDRIAWDSVRQGLRGDFNALFLKKMSDEPSDRGKGLAVVIGPAIINQMVDSYVTPKGLATLIRTGQPASPNSQMSGESRQVRGVNLKQIKYAFFSDSPLTFKVSVRPENESGVQADTELIFKWSGAWRLTRIFLPLNEAVAFAEKESAAYKSDSPMLPSEKRAKADSVAWGKMFRSQVERCWKRPYSATGPQKVEAVISLKLRRDGTIEGTPVPMPGGSGLYFRTYQEAALKAIMECQPYQLPAANFDEWKYFETAFNER
jgi:hypothetical protein